MFGLFKKLLKKGDESSPPAPPVTPKYARSASPGQPVRPAVNPFATAAAGGPASSSSGAPPPLSHTAAVRTPSSSVSGNLPDVVSLPLATVLSGLAPELQNLFSPNPAPNQEVQFALQGILPQLSSGRVRVAFGELRQSSPNGSCKAGPEHDAKLIDLPLASILSRINPALLPRKTQRQLMDVPKDVTGLFGAMGESVSAPVVAASAPSATAAAAPAPAPAGKRRSAVSADLESIPSPFSAPAAAPHVAMTATPPPPTPASPKRRSAVPTDLEGIPSPFSFPGAAATPPPEDKTPEPEPVAFQPEPEVELEEAPKIKFDPGVALGGARPASKPTAPAAASGRNATPHAAKLQEVKDENFITVPVAEVAEGWPEPVMAELQELGLGDASLSLPAGQIDLAMRKGKIVFQWKALRGWADNPTAASAPSSNDEVELTLPLKAVAPKFLALRQPKGRQKRAHVEESIPDLFSGGPEPTPAAAATVKPSPAPAATPAARVAPQPEVAPIAPAEPPPTARKSPPPGRISAANPNELVAKTAQMQGVTGALLAMNDGLVVASQLPKPLMGETVAAFLPQIFGRLTQFAGELKLGDLSSVMLIMDNCPWIIFRTGKVYFAVIGSPGEALPLPQLTAIVADIKRQNL